MRYWLDAVARARASTTEEPDAGKLHVRVCAGAPGNRRSYREMQTEPRPWYG